MGEKRRRDERRQKKRKKRGTPKTQYEVDLEQNKMYYSFRYSAKAQKGEKKTYFEFLGQDLNASTARESFYVAMVEQFVNGSNGEINSITKLTVALRQEFFFYRLKIKATNLLKSTCPENEEYKSAAALVKKVGDNEEKVPSKIMNCQGQWKQAALDAKIIATSAIRMIAEPSDERTTKGIRKCVRKVVDECKSSKKRHIGEEGDVEGDGVEEDDCERVPVNDASAKKAKYLVRLKKIIVEGQKGGFIGEALTVAVLDGYQCSLAINVPLNVV